jgi:hypothetical protein
VLIFLAAAAGAGDVAAKFHLPVSLIALVDYRDITTTNGSWTPVAFSKLWIILTIRLPSPLLC